MPKSEYAVKNIRRDLQKLNLDQLKKLAKERGLDKKEAAVHGNAQRRLTWITLLLLNDPEFQNQQPQEKPQKQEAPIPKKPVMPAIKSKVVYGLRRLPQIKTVTYSYGGVKL